MLEFTVQTSTAKQALLQLLSYAEQVLEHDARINALTLDDAELNNANVEDAFEAIRTHLRETKKAISVNVD